MRGDLITIDYLPDRGTVLTINGKVWGSTIAGRTSHRLHESLPRREAQRHKLRAGLLGQTSE